MWMLLLLLLAAWVIVSFIMFVIKGIFWLLAIGVVLFIVAALVGAAKSRSESDGG